MALENDLIAGLDPTPLPVIDASQLLQMVQQAVPENKRGLVYFSDVAPDIVNNPWLVRYVWIDPTTWPAVVKLFRQDTAVWEPIALAPLSVTTAMIADGAITPIKIAHGGAFQLLRTNPTGTGVEWWSLQLAADSIAVVSLVKSTQAGDFLRTTLDGSSVEWFTFDITNYLPAQSLSPNVIQSSGIPGDVLYVQDVSGNLSWTDVLSLIADGTISVTKISPGAANTYLKTDAGGNVGWSVIPSSTAVHGRTILTVADNPSINYTVPLGVYAIDVEVIGGGGGGLNTGAVGNCGASGGGYTRKLLAVTPGQLIPFVVGAGGPSGNPGQDGQDSSFNTIIIGNAGLKGSAGPVVIGGIYSGGDYGAIGQNGGANFISPSEYDQIPLTSNLAFSGGASGFPLSKGGGISTVPTVGGGGSSASPSTPGVSVGCTAQDGADGLIIITY